MEQLGEFVQKSGCPVYYEGMKERQFFYEGRQYQIQFSTIGGGITARAFLEGIPANISHSVDNMTGFDMETVTGRVTLDHLEKLATQDVQSGLAIFVRR